jgi:hypothetical protein
MGTRTNHEPVETARTLIAETSDPHGSTYQLWAEIIPCEAPRNIIELRFSSTWSGAKQPQDPQIKAKFLLDATGLDNLRRLLEIR